MSKLRRFIKNEIIKLLNPELDHNDNNYSYKVDLEKILRSLDKIYDGQFRLDTTGSVWRKLGNSAIEIHAFHWELDKRYIEQFYKTTLKIAKLLGYKE